MALYCKKCNCSIIISAKFCPECGTKLVEAEPFFSAEAHERAENGEAFDLAAALGKAAQNAEGKGKGKGKGKGNAQDGELQFHLSEAEYTGTLENKNKAGIAMDNEAAFSPAESDLPAADEIISPEKTEFTAPTAAAELSVRLGEKPAQPVQNTDKPVRPVFDWDDSHTDKRAAMPKNPNAGLRFNFSKPLCFVLALIMLATFFFPWMRANAVLNETRIFTDRGVNIFELPSFVKSCIDMALRLAGPGAELTQEGEHLVWILNALLMLITGLFFIIAVHFLLFGLIGLFSGGKPRYYFARIGGTLYFIALLLFIGIVFIGNSALASLSRQTTAEGNISLALSIAPTVYVYIAAALAFLFRVFGVWAIRRLNAESCLNRGKFSTAKREIKLLRRKDLLARIPDMHSNAEKTAK